jgi:hypothetical protein
MVTGSATSGGSTFSAGDNPVPWMAASRAIEIKITELGTRIALLLRRNTDKIRNAKRNI